MKPEKQIDRFREAVRLVILTQAVLESIDDFKGTTLYRTDVKNLINRLEKKLELMINEPLKSLSKNKEEFILMRISKGVDDLLNTALEDIANQVEDNEND